jgi:succinate dehydrogenase / fumarate reductase membrane anchor subunit
MSLRSPLGAVRGLGSAKSGTRHWWRQRLTAIALVPLAAWFVISLLRTTTLDYDAARAWLAAPAPATLMIAFVIALFWHAQLGLQVVIEDYVARESARFGLNIAVQFAAVLGALACTVAVLKIALGAA